ncbi:hypothetical protein BH09PSE5_BH09PSE5_16770 [soil metagenome]
MNYIKALIAVLIAYFCCANASAEARSLRAGVVVRVTDGDTIWVRTQGSTGRPLKVRLRNIDAPEICQAGGTEAKAALASLVMNRRIELDARATDSYDRTIADVWVNGQDVSGRLVWLGHAWSYGFRTISGRYAAEQQQARSSGRGLFAAGDAIEPRQFRKVHGPCDRPGVKAM